MPFPKIEDARSFSDEELASEVLEAKKKLLELRMLKATGRLEKPHEFKHTRHRLAQLMTIERERELTAKAAAEISSTESVESGLTSEVSTSAEASSQPETTTSSPETETEAES